MNRLYKYILPAIWIAAFFLTDVKYMGFSKHTPVYTHITCIFSHVNILHLLMNIIAYLSIHNLCRQTQITKAALPYSFAAAIAASFLFQSELITVGASGMIYAMIGFLTGAALAGRLTVANRKTATLFLAFITINIIAGFFIPGVNATIHLTSFLTALVLSFIHYKTTLRFNKKH